MGLEPRIARELHDELGQELTGLKMDLAWLREKLPSDVAGVQHRLRSTVGGVDRMLGTVCRIGSDLRPPMLDEMGLEAAVELADTRVRDPRRPLSTA